MVLRFWTVYLYGPAPLSLNLLRFFWQGYLILAPLDRCTYAQRQIRIQGMWVHYPSLSGIDLFVLLHAIITIEQVFFTRNVKYAYHNAGQVFDLEELVEVK